MPTTKKRSVFFEQRTVEVSFRSAENGSPAGLTCSPHLHRELELVYLRSGRVEAFADATRVELGPGDVFLSFPNQIHHYRSFDRKESYILFIIKPDLMPEMMELFHMGTPSSPVIRGAGNGSASVESIVTGGQSGASAVEFDVYMTLDAQSITDTSSVGGVYFTVVVETPTKLTKEQKELLRKLDATLEVKSSPQRKKFFDTLKDLFN